MNAWKVVSEDHPWLRENCPVVPPPCRHDGSPSIALVFVPKGRVVFPDDRIQNLCAQHFSSLDELPLPHCVARWWDIELALKLGWIAGFVICPRCGQKLPLDTDDADLYACDDCRIYGSVE